MVRALFAVAALVALISAPALARDRVALLIGNGAYEHTGRLKNPTNDVLAMYALLTSPALGFDGRDVEVVENGDRRAMARAIRRFRQRASQADTALLFFSGHGMEIGGQNYLIPTDAELKHPGDADFDAIPLDAAVAAAASASRLSVVIFDACRNNSFPSTARNGSTGFRMVTPDRPGQVIAFSTAPQEIAFDGAAALSPYTQALTEAIAADPSLDVRKLFTSLGAKTARYAGGPQRPFARFGDLPAEDIALIPAGLPDPVDPGPNPGPESEPQDQNSAAAQAAVERTKDPAEQKENKRPALIPVSLNGTQVRCLMTAGNRECDKVIIQFASNSGFLIQHCEIARGYRIPIINKEAGGEILSFRPEGWSVDLQLNRRTGQFVHFTDFYRCTEEALGKN